VAGGLQNKTQVPWRNISRFVKPALTVKNSIEKRSTESDDKINMRIAKASVELAGSSIWCSHKNYDLDTALEDELVKDFVNK
jgi:guanylate kinase